TKQPGWQEAYARYKRGLEAAVGRPLAFLQLDVGWRRPDWPEATKQMATFARSLGMKLGVLYNGDNDDEGDNAWTSHAWRNVVRVETELGIIPDQAIFVSWNRFPRRALPETSAEAHTWLMSQYALSRTSFEIHREDNGWQVKLLNEIGRPLAGQP